MNNNVAWFKGGAVVVAVRVAVALTVRSGGGVVVLRAALGVIPPAAVVLGAVVGGVVVIPAVVVQLRLGVDGRLPVGGQAVGDKDHVGGHIGAVARGHAVSRALSQLQSSLPVGACVIAGAVVALNAIHSRFVRIDVAGWTLGERGGAAKVDKGELNRVRMLGGVVRAQGIG